MVEDKKPDFLELASKDSCGCGYGAFRWASFARKDRTI